MYLLNHKIGQTNNLTGKYIMELSKWKHLQLYMNTFEPEYRKVQQVFETLEAAYLDMETANYSTII